MSEMSNGGELPPATSTITDSPYTNNNTKMQSNLISQNSSNKHWYQSYIQSRENFKNRQEYLADLQWKFNGFFKIETDFDKEIIPSKEIYTSISQTIGVEAAKNIDSLANFGSSKVWLFKFKTNDSTNDIIGKSVFIRNKSFTIKDANNANFKKQEPYPLTAKYRFLRLPPNLSTNTVKEFIELQNFAIKDSIKVSKEKYNDPEMSHMESGVIVVEFKYKLENNQRVTNLTGPNKVSKFKCIIQLIGYPPKCLACLETGHISRECQKAKLFCSKCKKRGHQTENCSYAAQATNINQPNDDEQNLEEMEEVSSQMFNNLAGQFSFDNLTNNNNEATHQNETVTTTTAAAAAASTASAASAKLAQNLQNAPKLKILKIEDTEAYKKLIKDKASLTYELESQSKLVEFYKNQYDSATSDLKKFETEQISKKEQMKQAPANEKNEYKRLINALESSKKKSQADINLAIRNKNSVETKLIELANKLNNIENELKKLLNEKSSSNERKRNSPDSSSPQSDTTNKKASTVSQLLNINNNEPTN
jgi:hypothetical protein